VKESVMSEKLRVALLLSEKDTGLEGLLSRAAKPGRSYEIVGAVATAPNSQALPILERWGIPHRCNDIREFHRSRNAEVRDRSLRPQYDRISLDFLSEFRPSAMALFGYLYVLSPAVLEAFPGRVLNIHDSDLTLMNGDGRPQYRGLHSTRDAILAGELFTRSTVHVATEEVDAGPILVRSLPYPVHISLVRRALEMGAMDLIKAYAYAHRGWMMRDGWGELMDNALTLLSQRGGPILTEREPVGVREVLSHG
jgi:phosphoribosylglycinamide formyltransferase-1